MIGFRVDANEKIATGHLMRCIAIAAECRKRGQQCIFLMAEDKETSRLRDRQFSFEILHTEWDQPEKEIQKLCEVVRRECLEWLVVDSYQATADYLSELNRTVPVMYIDDMAIEPYDVSALLHYGLCPDLEEYRHRYENTDTQVLAGLEYIPLREEFSRHGKVSQKEDAARENLSCQPGEVSSILITTGGTDPYNITGKLLGLCLAHQESCGYQYHVIIGSMNENEEILQNMASEYCQLHLHKNVTNMGDYMRQCQLAVSAGGTTLFELCACAVPTVCFSFADNQQPGTIGMRDRGVMPYAGDARETDVAAAIFEQLLSLIRDQALRRKYAVRMRKLVDGRGTERIADILCNPC